jgi:hypothetical protein
LLKAGAPSRAVPPCLTVSRLETIRAVRNPYATLDAFLTEHRLCRPGLDDLVDTDTWEEVA